MYISYGIIFDTDGDILYIYIDIYIYNAAMLFHSAIKKSEYSVCGKCKYKLTKSI